MRRNPWVEDSDVVEVLNPTSARFIVEGEGGTPTLWDGTTPIFAMLEKGESILAHEVVKVMDASTLIVRPLHPIPIPEETIDWFEDPRWRFRRTSWRPPKVLHKSEDGVWTYEKKHVCNVALIPRHRESGRAQLTENRKNVEIDFIDESGSPAIWDSKGRLYANLHLGDFVYPFWVVRIEEPENETDIFGPRLVARTLQAEPDYSKGHDWEAEQFWKISEFNHKVGEIVLFRNEAGKWVAEDDGRRFFELSRRPKCFQSKERYEKKLVLEDPNYQMNELTDKTANPSGVSLRVDGANGTRLQWSGGSKLWAVGLKELPVPSAWPFDPVMYEVLEVVSTDEVLVREVMAIPDFETDVDWISEQTWILRPRVYSWPFKIRRISENDWIIPSRGLLKSHTEKKGEGISVSVESFYADPSKFESWKTVLNLTTEPRFFDDRRSIELNDAWTERRRTAREATSAEREELLLKQRLKKRREFLRKKQRKDEPGS